MCGRTGLKNLMTIKKTTPRSTIQVYCESIIYEGPVGTPLQDFCRMWEKDHNIPPEERSIAAIVDNRLRELTVPVTRDISVKPVTLKTSDGNRIYRRTLSYLLVVAIAELFPNAKVVLDHAMPHGAFYCHMIGRDNLTVEELDQVKQRMWQIIEEDCAIERTNIPLSEAREIFSKRGDDDKIRLLNIREYDYLSVYKLRDYVDYFFGYMAPSTGYVRWFELRTMEDGFELQYPRRENPGNLLDSSRSPRLNNVFQQNGEWLRLMNLEDMGQLNEALDQGRAQEIILVNEALHERRIAEIGERVAEGYDKGARVVLIAGPTSSGKTTFSKRLAIQMMTHGLKPFTLEMDNYFVNRDLTPRDENGDYDFESLEAVNVERLNQDLLGLIAGELTQIPSFNFQTGVSSPGKKLQLSADTVIILEGIHGLNPGLTPSVPSDKTYRIYVSALTQLNIDRHNRVPTTDVRLLRRLVRDATYRNYSAEDTLGRWPSVRRGEKRNIFPHQENADSIFNTALVYELAALRRFAEPLLLRVDPDSPLRVESHRLLSFLRWVKPLDIDFIPDNSLIREFVGGSNLRDYHPGGQHE